MSANGLHRIRWRRVDVTRGHRTHRKSVRERLSKYTSKWCCGWSGKCWQTDSIGSDGDGLPCQDSIGLTASLFTIDLVNIHQSGVVAEVENVSKRTPSDPMETVALSRLHRTHRKSVRDRLSKYTSKWCCGWGGKCRQTDSIGSDGDGLPCQDSIGLIPSLFAIDLVNIHQSGVVAGVENVGKRTPSDPMETGCRAKSPSDSPEVSSRET